MKATPPGTQAVDSCVNPSASRYHERLPRRRTTGDRSALRVCDGPCLSEGGELTFRQLRVTRGDRGGCGVPLPCPVSARRKKQSGGNQRVCVFNDLADLVLPEKHHQPKKS